MLMVSRVMTNVPSALMSTSCQSRLPSADDSDRLVVVLAVACVTLNDTAGLVLLPLAFVAGGLQFFLSDTAIPATTPQLREWGIGDYGTDKLKVGEKDPIWMRAGTDILRAGSANADSTELKDVIIFRRDADGLLREQVYAETAKLDGGRWNLGKVLIYYRANLVPSRLGSECMRTAAPLIASWSSALRLAPTILPSSTSCRIAVAVKSLVTDQK